MAVAAMPEVVTLAKVAITTKGAAAMIKVAVMVAANRLVATTRVAIIKPTVHAIWMMKSLSDR